MNTSRDEYYGVLDNVCLYQVEYGQKILLFKNLKY